MKHLGLANRDLIAHVVLVGPAPAARYTARIMYGPLRYSIYTIQVFLLTANGVREVAMDLHLRDGAITDERRRSFGYHAISSAMVSEIGLRVDGMTLDAAQQDAGDLAESKHAAGDKLVFSQEFVLTLNNMQAVNSS
jgi:hypothetical protein